MTGPEPLKLDQLGRKEFQLFEETEITSLREPRARIIKLSDYARGPEGSSVEETPRPKYGCPNFTARANPKLRERAMGIFSRAYGRIRNKLGGYGRDFHAKYVAAADAFRPEVAPINGVPVPVGQTDAAYYADNQVIDEGAIYGTWKNKALRSLYKSSLKLAERMGGRVGERLSEFYRNIISKLEDRDHAVSTMAHESIHAGLEKMGLADHLSVPQNEGLTCAMTDEAMGRSTTSRGTSYHDYKHWTYKALHALGYRTATALIKSYRDGRISGSRIERVFNATYRRAA